MEVASAEEIVFRGKEKIWEEITKIYSEIESGKIKDIYNLNYRLDELIEKLKEIYVNKEFTFQNENNRKKFQAIFLKNLIDCIRDLYKRVEDYNILKEELKKIPANDNISSELLREKNRQQQLEYLKKQSNRLRTLIIVKGEIAA